MATATLLASGALGWNNSAGATAFTTASITPGTDRLLVLLVTAIEDQNGTDNALMTGATVVSSGSGPSWTFRQNSFAAALYVPVAGIWTAQIGGTSPGSFTVTWTRHGTGTPLAGYSYALYSVSGFDTSTPLGGNVCTSYANPKGDGAVTITLSAAPATDDITLALNHADDDASPPKGATFSSAFGTWTEDFDGASGTAYHAWNVGQRTGSTSTSVDWSDVNGGAANYGSAQAAIVVKNAAGGGGSTGTSSVSISHPSLASSGVAAGPVTGSGGISISHPSLAASGVAAGPVTGSGGISITRPSLAASGAAVVSGSGGTSTGPLILVASGSAALLGGATVTISHPLLVASGTVAPNSGPATLSIGPPSLAASGVHTAPPVTGTGALSITRPSPAGTGSSSGGGGAAATATLLAAGASGWESAAFTTFTTAAITPGTNCALVFLVGAMAQDGSGGDLPLWNTSTLVSSGSGPTWTQQFSTVPAVAYAPGTAVWTAVIGGTDPGSFSITWARALAETKGCGARAYALYKVTGFEAASPFGGGIATSNGSALGDGPVTVLLSAAPASADVTLALNIADEDLGTAHGATFSTSFGTWTEDADGQTLASPAMIAWNAGQRTSSTSTSVAWSDVNATGTHTYSSGQAAIVVRAGALAASSGSGGVSIGPAAISASGTHSAPAGTGTLTIGPLALAASGTYLAPPSTGSGAILIRHPSITNVAFRFVTAVSANKRYLLDQYAQPYFVQGNSPQAMPVNATLAEAATFFADQQARGVNSSQVMPFINNGLGGRTDGSNINGHFPFTNMSTWAGPYPENYWSHVDAIFNLAEQYGVTLWVTIIDNISWANTTSGFVGTISDANITAFGQFFGNRYKNRPNMVWVIGNDWGGGGTVEAKYELLRQAVVSTGDTHLWTTWNAPPDQSSWELSAWDSRHQVVWAYSYALPWKVVETAYLDASPTAPQPVIFAEGNYEGESWWANFGGSTGTVEVLRRTAWWPVTYGAFGHFYGQGGVWQWSDISPGKLNSTAAQHVARVRPLITSLPNWHTLVPDTSHALITSGYGAWYSDATYQSLIYGGDPGEDLVGPAINDYATASITPDGLLAVIYVPTQRTPWTLNTSVLSGTVTGYWFDPTTGAQTVAAAPWAIPVTSHTDGAHDWVLVLQGTSSSSGSGAISITRPSLAGSGTAPAPGFNGTASVTISHPVVVAGGTSAAPDFTGSAALTIGPPLFAGAGTFSPPGVAAVTIDNPVLAASGTSSPPVSGTGGVTIGPPTLVGTSGGQVAVPLSATGAAATVAPTVLYGSAVAVPAASSSGASTVAPTVFRCSTSVTPGASTAGLSASLVAASQDNLTFLPIVRSARATVIDPLVITPVVTASASAGAATLIAGVRQSSIVLQPLVLVARTTRSSQYVMVPEPSIGQPSITEVPKLLVGDAIHTSGAT